MFLTFTLNLLIDYGDHAAFSHAWSPSVKEHFYLVFPLWAWWLTKRPSMSRFVLVCAAILLLGIALRASAWLYAAALDPPRNGFVENIYYPTWNRLYGLLFGVVLATGMMSGTPSGRQSERVVGSRVTQQRQLHLDAPQLTQRPVCLHMTAKISLEHGAALEKQHRHYAPAHRQQGIGRRPGLPKCVGATGESHYPG